MIEYRARWIVPIASPPIQSGVMRVRGGRIVSIGPDSPASSMDSVADRLDLGSVALMPGLINAHTHLELSWLRGRIPETRTFPEWIRHVMQASRVEVGSEKPDVHEAIVQAIDEARRTGTVVLGDIGNTPQAVAPLAASGMAAVGFRELIGFNPPDARALVERALHDIASRPAAQSLRLGLAAHAPYSVAPALFRAIRAATDRTPGVPSSVHLGESVEELQFLMTGDGAWRRLLEDVGAWNPDWRPPACSPVDYLDSMDFLGPQTLVVHGVHFSATDLRVLAARRATIVTCPRGNLRTRAGAPPVADFVRSGVRLAVGTDSLGSVDDLQMFAELAELRRLGPMVAARDFLVAATAGGAAALGFGDDYGTLEPGRRADAIAIDLPLDVDDVEEYLVGGIHPDQIRWAEDLARERGITGPF